MLLIVLPTSLPCFIKDMSCLTCEYSVCFVFVCCLTSDFVCLRFKLSYLTLLVDEFCYVGFVYCLRFVLFCGLLEAFIIITNMII